MLILLGLPTLHTTISFAGDPLTKETTECSPVLKILYRFRFPQTAPASAPEKTPCSCGPSSSMLLPWISMETRARIRRGVNRTLERSNQVLNRQIPRSNPLSFFRKPSIPAGPQGHTYCFCRKITIHSLPCLLSFSCTGAAV